jgi:phospholipase C
LPDSSPGGDDGGTDAPASPDAADAAPHPAALPIKHVIFLVKENRTYDNYFGAYPGGNGATKATLADGGTVPLGPLYDRSSPDISHAWEAALIAYADGGMNAFEHASANAGIVDDSGAPHAFQTAKRDDIPRYWQLADEFVLGDNFFSSLHGPSFPNHLYTIAAQSGGVRDNPGHSPDAGPAPKVVPGGSPGEAGLEPDDIPPLSVKKGVWGCDADPQTRVPVLDQEGEVEEIYPCLDFPTLGDELDSAGVSWKMYAPNTGSDDAGFQGSAGYIWTVYDAIRHMRDSPLWGEHVVPTDQFLQDAQNGTLPAVSWISTPSPVSEHPPASVCVGENWTVSLIQALASGPNWGDSVMFVTWDDWGGFYDHVPPEQIDVYGLGFRVPLLVVSPYAKKGFVDHTRAEFSSVLRFIETDFGLPPLTDRDKNATDMTEAFDFAQAPRTPPTLAARTCP